MTPRRLVEDGLRREDFTEERLARLMEAVDGFEEGAQEEDE